MLGESQLNVLIQATDLSPYHRQRLQAQLQTALRTVPGWLYDMLSRHLQSLGAANLSVIVEPRAEDDPDRQALGLGRIGDWPAIRLRPRLHEDGVDWGQDPRYLLAKGIAYALAPNASDSSFWSRWREAALADDLAAKAAETGAHWMDATELGLLVEMFAAYALTPDHRRWAEMPATRAFMDAWRQSGSE